DCLLGNSFAPSLRRPVVAIPPSEARSLGGSCSARSSLKSRTRLVSDRAGYKQSPSHNTLLATATNASARIRGTCHISCLDERFLVVKTDDLANPGGADCLPRHHSAQQ